jgi:transposase-like protein
MLARRREEKANGLYRSNADKQRAVKAALTHEKSAGLSDCQIAKHCGVSAMTISRWRPSLTKLEILPSRTVTRGETTYQQNTANIGRKAQPAPAVEASPEPEEIGTHCRNPIVTVANRHGWPDDQHRQHRKAHPAPIAESNPEPEQVEMETEVAD